MEYFPNNRGLITGIIEGAYGLGSFIFNLLATKIVNPDGDAADIKTDDPNLNIFQPEVANRVPVMLRHLCIVWYCLVLLAAFLISKPSKQDDQNEEHQIQNPTSEASDDGGLQDENQNLASADKVINLVRPYACVESTRFWQYFGMMFLANIFGGFFSYQFKSIYEAFHDQGEEKLNADNIMSWAAILSGVV